MREYTINGTASTLADVRAALEALTSANNNAGIRIVVKNARSMSDGCLMLDGTIIEPFKLKQYHGDYAVFVIPSIRKLVYTPATF